MENSLIVRDPFRLHGCKLCLFYGTVCLELFKYSLLCVFHVRSNNVTYLLTD